MKIYKVSADFDKFDVCGLDKEACRESNALNHLEDLELHIDFDGTSQLKSWWPRVIERHNDKPKLGDYISTLGGGAMILEKKAVDNLKPLMDNIEILPLDCDFGDYWAINVLNVLECINYEKSDFILLSDELTDGRPRIMWFNKYSFVEEKVDGYSIFKIIDMPKADIFVNEFFVDSVKKHGITGFKFELVWQSQDAEIEVRSTQSVPSQKSNRGRILEKKKAIVTPLEDDVVLELQKMEQKAYELIGIDHNSSPSEIVSLIFEYVEKLLLTEKREEEISGISILLATAWGFSICREYKWEWTYLEVKGEVEKSYYLLSPDHWYCCPPFYFFQKILTGNNLGADGKNDNTIQLLFNMIKTISDRTQNEKYTVIS